MLSCLEWNGAELAGNITVPANTTYTFSMNNDDGALLYVDTQLVVDYHGPSLA